ncbi:hypothetical protein [Segnochrobactrum spirostomi]|uniref:Uncharacterized protein n=1 Tax=Segnochrobactrum spirostomi TaxID=2608987 RepID=A0A6A7Y2H9_9HYPH|nr:hypothetical protein [Segnochrobactrum spirostomi]MQT13284.1 hypothetical protein [Segnochrobactrum spirostomi]
MADYYSVLQRAVGTLPENTGQARRAIYEKARTALVRQLESIDPPLPASEITKQRLALEEAVRRIEQEASRAALAAAPRPTAPRPAAPPPPPVAAPQPSAERPSAGYAPEGRPVPPVVPSRAAPEARSYAPPVDSPAAPAPLGETPAAPPEPQAPPRVTAWAPPIRPIPSEPDEPVFPPDPDAPAAEAEAPKKRGLFGRSRKGGEPMPADPFADRAEPAAPMPAAPPSRADADDVAEDWVEHDRLDVEEAAAPPPRKSGRGRIIAIVVVLVLVAAAAVAYMERSRITALLAHKSTDTASTASPPATAQPADTQPADTGAPKDEDRLPSMSGGSDASTSGNAGTPAAPADTTPAPPASTDTSAPAQQPATPADNAGAEQPSTPAPAAPPADTQSSTDNTQVAPGPATATLYEEGEVPGSRGGAFTGDVTWTMTRESFGGGAPEPLVRAVIDIPEKSMKVTLVVRQNRDAALPASHLVEISFDLGPKFNGGGIQGVPGIIMKRTSDDRGDALLGASARVSDNLFWIALSSSQADKARNLELLGDREWIDVPMVFTNGKRAILTIRKGTTGDAAMKEALAAWNGG